jgi:K+-transporting ATPase A subunit
VFSGICVLALYALLRTQGLHPFNPNGFHSGTWDVSAFSQMAGIAVHTDRLF